MLRSVLRPSRGRPPVLPVVALAVLLSWLVLPRAARATPYWTSADYERSQAEAAQAATPLPATGARPAGSASYAEDYIHTTADFLPTLQVSDSLSLDFGGEREGEHLPGIIQSDNTHEVVWAWSRLKADYGVDSLMTRVVHAWTYLGRNPAYNEEGSSSPDSGYYRVYNCGWALRAEMEYRRATGDTSHRVYGDSCALYLMQHPLNLHYGPPSGFYGRLNGLVEAWGMGNLHDYGLDVGNASYLAAASATADSVRAWVQEDSTRLNAQVWAMSGGAAMWGLVHSYFATHPSLAPAWIAHYAPSMGVTVGGGQYANAWNGWFALGHWAVWEMNADPAQLALHRNITDSLLIRDGDGDGGIPVRYIDNDSQDQSWVSSYMAYMGLDRRRLLVTSVAGAAPPAAGSSVTRSARAVPNPFQDGTVLRFHNPAAAELVLAVYDALGREVWTSAPRVFGPGEQELAWDGRGTEGAGLAPGLYFYRLLAGAPAGAPSVRAAGKLLLVR